MTPEPSRRFVRFLLTQDAIPTAWRQVPGLRWLGAYLMALAIGGQARKRYTQNEGSRS